MDADRHGSLQNAQNPPVIAQPLPPESYSGASPHLILVYGHPASLIYDLRRQPSDACPRYPDFVKLEWAYESAMCPAVSTLTLTCGILPQPVVITPSHTNFEFVIVQDVLVAVHEAYQIASNEHHNATDMVPASNLGPSFFSENSTVLTRHMWGGISEETAPGQWLVHIE